MQPILLSGQNVEADATCHPVAPHPAHLVLSPQGGQQRGSDGDAIQHGAELQDEGLLFQAFRQLRKFICFNRSLINTGWRFFRR